MQSKLKVMQIEMTSPATLQLLLPRISHHLCSSLEATLMNFLRAYTTTSTVLRSELEAPTPAVQVPMHMPAMSTVAVSSLYHSLIPH